MFLAFVVAAAELSIHMLILKRFYNRTFPGIEEVRRFKEALHKSRLSLFLGS